MAPFPAWMVGFPYGSSSSSSTSDTTITIHNDKVETTLRRRSPGSPFGYFEDVKVENKYHIDPDHKRTTRSPLHTHNQNRHAPKPKPKPKPATTIITEFTKFFHREWKCLTRGRWAQSRIAAFSSGPVLFFGSLMLLSSFVERRGRGNVRHGGRKRRKGRIGGMDFSRGSFLTNSKVDRYIYFSSLYLQCLTASNYKILSKSLKRLFH